MAVLGAGPGGLALAIAAAQSGHRVTVFEARSSLSSAGTWLLGTGAQRVLSNLGLESTGPTCAGATIVDPAGGRLLRVHYRRRPRVVLRNWLLEGLGGRAEELGVELRLSTRLTAPPEADVVVGADGCDSTVRRWSGLRAFTRPLGHFYRGRVAVRVVTEPREIWMGKGRRFGFDPLPDGTGFYCTAPSEDPVDLESFLSSWDNRHAQEVLRACDWSTVQRCRPLDVWCPRWAAPPFFLLGDAAHGQPPNLGQGANLAVMDGFVLGRLLEPDLHGTARRYQRLRMPPALTLHLLAHLVQAATHRPAWVKPLDRVEALKNWAAQQTACEVGGLSCKG